MIPPGRAKCNRGVGSRHIAPCGFMARVEDVLTNRRFARHRPAPRLRAVSATFGAKAVVSAISFTACPRFASYLNEFAFRSNHRHMRNAMFDFLIGPI